MAKRVERWEASDGKIFETEGEAWRHDLDLQLGERAEKFASEYTESERERTRARNIIMKWEEWKLAQRREPDTDPEKGD